MHGLVSFIYPVKFVHLVLMCHIALRLSEVSNEPLDLFISLNTHGIPLRKVVGFETLSIKCD